MKIFNDLLELWNYCNYCPLCQKHVRVVKIDCSDEFHLISCKADDKLTITFSNRHSDYGQDITCDIDWFTGKICSTAEIDPTFYFWMSGACNDCGATYAASEDIVVVNDRMQIEKSNMINIETINLHFDQEVFYIEYDYELNIIYVSQYATLKRNLVIKLPILKLDFSDLHKVKQKIKNLLLLS